MKKIIIFVVMLTGITGAARADETIEIMAVDNVTTLYPQKPGARFLAWGDDTATLIFYYQDNFQREFYYTDCKGNYLRPLLNETREIIDFKLSPDARFLAYRKREFDNTVHLYILRIGYNPDKSQPVIQWRKELGAPRQLWDQYQFLPDTDILRAVNLQENYGRYDITTIYLGTDTMVSISVEYNPQQILTDRDLRRLYIYNSRYTHWLTRNSDNRFQEVFALTSAEILQPVFSRHGDIILYVRRTSLANGLATGPAGMAPGPTGSVSKELWYYDPSDDQADGLLTASFLNRPANGFSVPYFVEDRSRPRVYCLVNNSSGIGDTALFHESVENNIRSIDLDQARISDNLLSLNLNQRVTDFILSRDGRMLVYLVFDRFGFDKENRTVMFQDLESGNSGRVLEGKNDRLCWPETGPANRLLVVQRDGTCQIVTFTKKIKQRP